eukprot:scaffold33748_cov166-Skeletonema_menzelii.AAC.1
MSRKLATTVALLLMGAVSSFAPMTSVPSSSQRIEDRIRPFCSTTIKNSDDDEDSSGMFDGTENMDGNWMKKSTSIDFMPSEMQNSKDDSTYMDVGINGKTFGIGDLSRRMHEALMVVASKQFPSGIPEELGDVYLLYSMDASAKEAVKVAMDSNGYTLNLGDDESMQDEGAWGQIESVTFVDSETGDIIKGEDGSTSYESFTDAIAKGGWEPGDGFSFVVREVPSRKKAMDLEALLRALDPDGTLWDEAKEKGMLLPGDDICSLKDLATDCVQRVNSAPTEAKDEFNVYRGGTSMGYNVIQRSSLLKARRNPDGRENKKTLLHVMDSLANHGCIIVDLTDEGKSPEVAETMSGMWDATESFFKQVIEGDAANTVTAMGPAEGVGSSHAMVGYASFKDGDNQFLETRISRTDGSLLPKETSSVIGDEGAKSMVDAFNIMSEVGKDIVRIATAASSDEAGAFVTVGSVVSQDDDSPSIAGLSFEEATVSGVMDEDTQPSDEDIARASILASEAATLLTEEIMDDGKPLPESANIAHDEGQVSMSPHRICRYSNGQGSKRKAKPSEIFGAHTDTTFVTIVPAAAVSGLEVYDEDSLQWYRPELNARKHAKSVDPKGEMDSKFPWHSRYLVVMPGELLQITSRNNIPASVHRVVAAPEIPRLSAPVLLRARPGTKMDVERYMGSLDKAGSLLLETNDMKMEDIHAALQSTA